MPTVNHNSLIQIIGPEKGQCGIGAKASSAYSHRATLQPLSSPPPKPQLEQELPYRSLGLDASVGDFSLSTVDDACLGEGEMQACAQLSVDAGDSSLVRSVF